MSNPIHDGKIRMFNESDNDERKDISIFADVVVIFNKDSRYYRLKIIIITRFMHSYSTKLTNPRVILLKASQPNLNTQYSS